MDSKHQGEVSVDLGDRRLTICFTVRALAQIRATFADNQSIASLMTGSDPVAVLTLLVIGACKHHPDLTVDALMDMVLPMARVKEALLKALNYAYWGPDGPPGDEPNNGSTGKGKAAKNPQPPAATKSRAGSASRNGSASRRRNSGQ